MRPSGEDLVSERARQSSVRLRQMLSALRRSLRSMAWGVLLMLVGSSVGSGLPVMAANAEASEAVVSRAWKTGVLTMALALSRADCNRG